MPVSRITDVKVGLTMRLENVNAAKKNLQQTNTPKQEPVPDHAEASCVGIKSIRKIGKEPVYNMEVEDNHNFAINGGLIVHNCMDSMRYFVKTKKIIRKTLQKSMDIYDLY